MNNDDREREVLAWLKTARGGAFDTPALCAAMRCTPEDLRRRRESFELVWWVDDSGRCHYPRWQFGHDGRVNQSIVSVLRILRPSDPMDAVYHLLCPQSALDERSLLDLIEAGDAENAIRRAREMALPPC